MPLKLRSTGLASPIDKDRKDYTVYSGEWPMGRISEERGAREDQRWFWSLHGILGKPLDMRTDGRAPHEFDTDQPPFQRTSLNGLSGASRFERGREMEVPSA